MTRQQFKYDYFYISSGTATSNTIDITGVTSMVIFMPSTWTAADIGFYVNYDRTATYTSFMPLAYTDGTLVEIDSPAVDEAYIVPDEVFKVPFVKLWSHQSGALTDVNQGGNRTIYAVMS